MTYFQGNKNLVENQVNKENGYICPNFLYKGRDVGRYWIHSIFLHNIPDVVRVNAFIVYTSAVIHIIKRTAILANQKADIRSINC